MKHRVRKSIFDVNVYIPGRPIDEIKRELGINSIVKLASNENPYGPSPKVLKAISKASRYVNRYPDGSCYYLRKMLASHLNVGEGQLIFGNGSDELIVMAVRAFVENSDEVVISYPSFLIYEIASKCEGARIKRIPLVDFRYDLDAMLKAITKRTKIVFVGNPDNPSGQYLTQPEAEEFLDGIPEDVLVFFDEAYYEYITARDYVKTIRLLKKYKNLFITRTFSKMYGLAGLRIGYGIAREEIVDLLNRVRQPFNVNSIAQAAAMACLQDKQYYADIARKIKAQRLFLYKGLKSIGVDFVKGYANFILIDTKNDSSIITAELLKRGVIVRDMKFCGMDTFIRVTIGTEKENRRFLSVFGRVYSKNNNSRG